MSGDPRPLIPFMPVTIRLVSLGFSGAQLCPSDPQRVYLEFSCSRPSEINVLPDFQPASGQGWICTHQNPPLKFSFRESGPLCQREWFGFGFGFADICAVVEVRYLPELNRGVPYEDFRSESGDSADCKLWPISRPGPGPSVIDIASTSG